MAARAMPSNIQTGMIQNWTKSGKRKNFEISFTRVRALVLKNAAAIQAAVIQCCAPEANYVFSNFPITSCQLPLAFMQPLSSKIS